MKTPRREIAQVMAKATLQKGVSASYVKSVAAFLLSERRVSELDSLLRDIQAGWAHEGYVEATAQSTHPLTDELQDSIKSQLKELYPEAGHITLRQQQDPDIIGGVRISLPNQQLDLSIETKLNKFKQLTAA